MRYKLYIIIIILLVLAAFGENAAFAYWIWTPQTKKWINPRYAPKDTPKEQLLYSMDLFEAKDYKKALDEFKKVVSYYPRSESAAEAQYYIGRCQEELQNYYQAFLAYQEGVEKYPFSQRLDETVKREYDIGEKLFSGEKVKFIGMSFSATPEQIIEIFQKVVSDAPYSEYAPTAQYKIGELYKRLGFYNEAIEAFQKITTNYPDSAIADDAKYQVAICAASGSPGSAYDQQLTAEAIKKFDEYVKANPDSVKVKEAQKEKGELIEKKARSLYSIAHFYERRGKPNSAIIYYDDIVNNFPSSSIAPSAMERAETLKKKSKR
ncbi:MAG: tetratricopeptide repeat protein [Candidatus Omnitrophica bacterium]|nr:tetratricopeptide repeat protein [Candidatus Omnitrophota bacterium]